ncbi:MAG: hypothetical protein R3F50_10985 [Gammaproteobacteria bacterium]
MSRKRSLADIKSLSQYLSLLLFLAMGNAFAVLPDPIIRKPDQPVIFLHGLGGDPFSWLFAATLLDANDWDFGGLLRTDPQTNLVEPINAGDFYVVEFSDNQGLTLAEQGNELADYVDTVLAANPSASNVVLVGHSMGAMASRAYLQWTGAEGKVSQLIAIGAPHGGSQLTVFAQQECSNGNNLLICELLEEVLGIDPFSAGVSELRPDSIALSQLNDLQQFPLPADVYYTSIIGDGTPVIGVGDDGDGVISTFYQNLGNVPGVAQLDHFAVSITVADRASCDPGFTPDPVFGIDLNPFPNQTHTCETTDENVLRAILWTILSGPPAATTLVLDSDELVLQQTAAITVTGADPGEEVLFAGGVDGAGENAGPCLPPEQGALCLDILNPLLLGAAVADSGGVATLTLPIDGSPDDVGMTVSLQAIILRGSVPVASDVVTRQVAD